MTELQSPREDPRHGPPLRGLAFFQINSLEFPRERISRSREAAMNFFARDLQFLSNEILCAR